MRKLNFFLSGVLLAVCIAARSGARLPAEAAGTQYYLGGMTAGFSLSANGVEIVAFKEVASESGGGCPAAQAGMKTGDLIVAVDGIHTRTIAELGDALARSGGSETQFIVKRDGESLQMSLTPLKDKKDGKYKIGILIRDTFSGIGTVTYIEKGAEDSDLWGTPSAMRVMFPLLWRTLRSIAAALSVSVAASAEEPGN